MKPILLPRLTLSILSAFTLATVRGEPSQNVQPQVMDPEISVHLASESEGPANAQPFPENRFHASASLGEAIDAFKRNPSDENRSSVKFALAKLNLDIRQQEDRLNKTTGADHAKTSVRLEELKKYRTAQMDRLPSNSGFVSLPAHRRHLARVNRDERGLPEKAKDSALDVKDKMVSGAERMGSKAKAGAKEAAYKTKEGAVTVGEKVEAGSKKVGRTIGKGFRKTGEAIERASEPE